MANLLDRGTDFLMRSLEASAAVDGGVTYTRGSESVRLAAWVGRTVFRRTQNDPGAAVIFGERDYLFRAADLIVGGQVTTPKKGDSITEGQTVYMLVTPDGDEPVWRWSDQLKGMIRVHCKRV
ncbi:MAG: hypothetical protein K2P78_04110 [Gemmataceae bacterium]|nr:hypothetical protein [Gemmataceae bacterium]